MRHGSRRRNALLALAAALAAVRAVQAGAPDPVVTLAPEGKQPRAAAGRDGFVAVVYGQGTEVFCRVSRDGGATYADATRVGRLDGLMLGMRRGPQVAVSGSSIVVTAISKLQGGLVAWRSADAGRAWTGPTTVNDRPRSAREGLHALAAGANQQVHVVWLDLRDDRTEVYAATSPDGGASWAANRLVFESAERTVCECCQPTIAADDAGRVAVMFRNLLDGARDMYLVRSGDSGRSFGAAAKLGRGTWPLRGCPMDGGGVAVRGEQVETVWRREDVVYAAAPGSEERALGKGRNGAVAVRPDGPYLAWQTPEGDVVLEAPDAAPTPVGRGRFPALGVGPGANGPLVLTWEDPERGAMARTLAR